jgi:glycine/D-amino acid oxidase-like deaminating enzyme
MTRYDAIVIGGGLVGSAVAYGLAREGLGVALVDEGDVAYRASRGNFGLVWVQSKGDGAPHYQRWTRRSADQWPALAAELSARTGISVGHERPGGVHLCLGEAEFEERRARMERMRLQSGNFGFEYRMLDRRELADVLPGLGPSVTGASWTPYDGMPTRSICCTRCTRRLSRKGDAILRIPRSATPSRRPAISASRPTIARSARRRSFSPPASAMRVWPRCSG